MIVLLRCRGVELGEICWGRLPNACYTPAGDSLVLDSCSGLNELPVRDLLEHDLGLCLQELNCCFSPVWPRWSQREWFDVEGLIEVLSCFSHERLLCDN